MGIPQKGELAGGEGEMGNKIQFLSFEKSDQGGSIRTE
uniref:Uncharacterized protein n=1 Tax=Cucumis melo TaxID=3656 RepID=A0A9I9E4I8_CUCME